MPAYSPTQKNSRLSFLGFKVVQGFLEKDP